MNASLGLGLLGLGLGLLGLGLGLLGLGLPGQVAVDQEPVFTTSGISL